MTLTVRGVALGTAIFALIVAVIWFVQIRQTIQAAHLMPGQQIGFDIRSMAIYAFKSPAFWIAFAGMIVIGNWFVNAFKH